jgi:hypothetical protein
MFEVVRHEAPSEVEVALFLALLKFRILRFDGRIGAFLRFLDELEPGNLDLVGQHLGKHLCQCTGHRTIAIFFVKVAVFEGYHPVSLRQD